MNSKDKNVEKRIYSQPLIERVKLDNGISLILESPTPAGEPTFSQASAHFDNDPFKTNMG